MERWKNWLPYGRQDISERDIAAVVDVLRSDFLTQGPMVPAFEESVASFCGSAHGVAVSSGTAALHLSLRALDVGHGDLVWTSPITFVASANAARYCGAKVDFVDVDPETANLCPEALETKLKGAKEAGRLPKVVIPVHFGGQPCEVEAIGELADEYGFAVLEDAAHGLGGAWKDERTGSCRWSKAAIHSFHPVKIVTSGEGGMVTTNHEQMAMRLRELRSHGITRDPDRMESRDEGPWYYEQRELGYHYRLTDLQAALGRSQMERLEEFVQKRADLARAYDEALGGLDTVRPLKRSSGARSAWHLYVIRVDAARSRQDRRGVFEQLRECGIGVNVHYIPVHLQPDFRRLGFQRGICPRAEAYYESCLTLPLFPGMDEEDVARVASALRNATS